MISHLRFTRDLLAFTCLLAALAAATVLRASNPIVGRASDTIERQQIGSHFAPLSGSTMGTKNLLMIRIDFSDVAGEPISLADANHLLADEVAPFFHYASFGAFTLNPTVTDKTYRLANPSTTYTTSGDRAALHADACTAASADYTLADYDLIMVVFPRLESVNVVGSGFEFGGLAELGGSRTWINGRENIRLLVIAHELGHNLGLGHANSVTADDWPLVLANSLEYGDTEDMMGNGTGHYNPADQAKLGWLPAGAIATPTAGTQTFRLYAQTESTGTATLPVTARFAGANGLTYWIFPRASGFAASVAVLAASDASTATATIETNTPQGQRLLMDIGDYYADLDTATMVSVVDVGYENGIPYADCAITLPAADNSLRLTAPLAVTDASNGVRVEASLSDPDATVQWQKRLAESTAWVALVAEDLVSQPSATTVVVRRDTGVEDIRVVVTNSGGQATSTPLHLVASPVLAPASVNLGAGLQRYYLGVSMSGPWSLSSDSDWVTLTPASGSGPLDVLVTVAANTTGTARQGSVTLGAITHAISQSSTADEPNTVFATGTAAIGPQVTTANQPIPLGSGFTAMTSPGVFAKADGSRWALARQMLKYASADWLTVPAACPRNLSAAIGRLVRVPDDVVAFSCDRNNGGRYLVLKTDGSLYSNSTFPENGEAGAAHVAAKVADHVAKLACGSTVAAFIDTSGGLWAFGQNYFGEVGDGTTTPRTTPVQVASNVADVSSATHQHWFVTTAGQLNGVGKQCYSALGTPQGFDTNVRKVAAGGVHTIILKLDGTVWAVGRNAEGQLGDGTWTPRDTPVQIATGISDISVGLNATYLLRADGVLLSFGWNGYGQLGDGTRINRNHPLAIDRNVTALFENQYLKADGTLWATGGTLSDPPQPLPADHQWYGVGARAVKVAAGWHLSWILDDTGRLYASGMGQDADDPPTCSWQLVESDVQDICSTNVGNDWLAVRKSNGEVWGVSWTVPLHWSRMLFGTDVSSVAFPAYSMLWEAAVVKTDGTLWKTSWTVDGAGAVSAPSYDEQVAPDVACAADDPYFIHYVSTGGTLYRLLKSTGAVHSLAENIASVQISSIGSGYCRTTDGQLLQLSGDGTTTRIASDVTSFSVGYTHVLYQTSDGSLWGTGSDTDGQLGAGTGAAYMPPSSLIALQAAGFAAGDASSLFLGHASDLAHIVSAPADNTPICNTPDAEQDVFLTEGYSHTLTTTWTYNTGIAWQWYKDGTALPQANSNSYSFPTPTQADAGRYTCRATTAAGSTDSPAFVVTVQSPAAPVIIIQPSSMAVADGRTARFAFAVSSAPAPNYQWQVSTNHGVTWFNLSDTAAYSGAATSMLSVTGATVGDSGSKFRCVAANASGTATSRTVALTVHSETSPVITEQPPSQEVVNGQQVSLSIATTGASSYQWFKGGVVISNATGSSLTIPAVAPADAGIYDVIVTGPGGDTLSAPIVVGVVPASGDRTAGSVTTRDLWQNIHHPNGAVYDQFSLSGAAGTFTADPGQIARMSFLDENESIVQVEMSGAGAITVVLAGATGPMAPALYNQPTVQYMKGKATIILAGADATTHFTIYSVGTVTNPAVTRSDVPYAGWASIAAAGIVSTNGSLGGIHQGNVAYNATTGCTGIYAPTVTTAASLLVVHDIAASGSAQPYLYFGGGGTVNVKIAGSALAQPNGDSLTVNGIAQLTMGAGRDSCGAAAPAEVMQGALVDDSGTDVTSAIVTGP